MRHGLKATLGPIVQGLLAVGLCVLVVCAQQPAAPAGATAPAPSQADAKTKSTAAKPASDTTPAPSQDTSSDQNTGVSNPDPVTPEAAPAPPEATPAVPEATPAAADQNSQNDDVQPPAGPDNKDELKPSGNRFVPDQPPPPVTPELDSNKPSPPDAGPAPTFPVTTVAPSSAAPQGVSSTPAEFAPQSVPAAPDKTTAPAAAPDTPPHSRLHPRRNRLRRQRRQRPADSSPAPAAPADATAPQSAPAASDSCPQRRRGCNTGSGR